MKKIMRVQAVARKMTDPRAEDALIELEELQELETRAREKRAVVAALDDLLDGELDNRAHGLVLAKKQVLEREITVMDRQLSRVGEIEQTLTDQAVENVIAEDLTRAGAIRMVPMLVKFLREEHGIGGVIGDDGTVVLDRESLARKIELLKHEPGFEPLFGEAGGGLQGDRGNPWRVEAFNLTEQGKIYERDPKRARQLQTDACQAMKDSQGLNLTELGRLMRDNPAKGRELAEKYGLQLPERVH
ncbi:MAG: hypothetical protein ABFD97_02880 [Syntrophobacter sp.]